MAVMHQTLKNMVDDSLRVKIKTQSAAILVGNGYVLKKLVEKQERKEGEEILQRGGYLLLIYKKKMVLKIKN